MVFRHRYVSNVAALCSGMEHPDELSVVGDDAAGPLGHRALPPPAGEQTGLRLHGHHHQGMAQLHTHTAQLAQLGRNMKCESAQPFTSPVAGAVAACVNRPLFYLLISVALTVTHTVKFQIVDCVGNGDVISSISFLSSNFSVVWC